VKITILALAPWVSRQTDLIGNCDIEILQFQIQIQIKKDQNLNFEHKFEIWERNETEIIDDQK
jgi:hypothetical protein